MGKTIEIKITSDGDVVIPWIIEDYEEVVSIIKKELGEEDERIRIIYGSIHCG